MGQNYQEYSDTSCRKLFSANLISMAIILTPGLKQSIV